MELYILDKNLSTVWVVDEYSSLIWAKRYREIGDCELYIPASATALDVLKMGHYITRTDDDMVCRINYLELQTDAENGDYLIVKGVDVKAFLYQRIVWGTGNCRGNLEAFISLMVDKQVGAGASSWRIMKKANGGQLIYQAPLQGFDVINTEQVSYKNVGEKVREYCEANGWGYRMTLEAGKLYFGLYAGQDKRDEVIFSDEYENLSTTTYRLDETNLGNVALVAGEGEGNNRAKEVSGAGTSTDRYEIFVDAKDISREVSYSNLLATFPGGSAVLRGATYYYNVTNLDVQIVDAAHLSVLRHEYPGEVVTVGGIEYYRVYSADVAALPAQVPGDNDTCTLTDLIYTVYLLNRGYEKLAAFGAVTAFEGTIEPRGTFEYKTDYDLGDLVTVQSNYGVSAVVRITEVIEKDDGNGYSVEPAFEYVED